MKTPLLKSEHVPVFVRYTRAEKVSPRLCAEWYDGRNGLAA